MEYDYHEAMKLTNQLCFPLYAASRQVISLYTPWLKPLGLTYTQYIVFLALWEKDGIPVGELCEKLMLDNGTLSPLLDAPCRKWRRKSPSAWRTALIFRQRGRSCCMNYCMSCWKSNLIKHRKT